jgi:hypothetical protein
MPCIHPNQIYGPDPNEPPRDPVCRHDLENYLAESHLRLLMAAMGIRPPTSMRLHHEWVGNLCAFLRGIPESRRDSILGLPALAEVREWWMRHRAADAAQERIEAYYNLLANDFYKETTDVHD